MNEADFWCEFCGDERPCECDEQLSHEWHDAADEDREEIDG